MANIRKEIVEESDLPAVEVQAINLFLEAGWPPEVARWLGPFCFTLLPKDNPWSINEANLQTLARAWNESGALGFYDRALLMVYVRLCGCGGLDVFLDECVSLSDDWPATQCWSLPESEWVRVADELRSHDRPEGRIDFEGAFVRGGWPGIYGNDGALINAVEQYVRCTIEKVVEPSICRLTRVLANGAKFDLSRFVNPGIWLVTPNPDLPERLPRKPNNEWSIANHTALTTWLMALGPSALGPALKQFQSTQPTMLSGTAFGARRAIQCWLSRRTGDEMAFSGGGAELAAASEPFLDVLERHCCGVEAAGDPLIRRAWLWFSLCTFEADPNRLTNERREQILHAATEDLSQLRKLFSRAMPKRDDAGLQGEGWGNLRPDESRATWEEFEWERDHFHTCVRLLYQFGGVWRGMKPLLLALRSLSTPAVAADLRYWPEPRPNMPESQGDRLALADPPQPWSIIPASMIYNFHAFVGREQKDDPELVTLRGNLASFCLERLVDRWTKNERENAAKSGRRRTNGDMVERSPEWRFCLIRAITALRINPEGKGHRVLHAASQIDPDDEVRDEARQAYERLRRGAELPEDVSPRRAIMSALFWIRQAHLLGLKAQHPELEIQLDADGAQRTRIKELTRTTESERSETLRNQA